MINGIGGYADTLQMSAMRGQPGNPFEKIDENGDGLLNETEFGEIADKVAEMTGQTADASELFANLDADGDGSLSQAEFDAGRPAGPPPGMGGGMPGDMIQELMDTLSEAEDEDSDVGDTLDADGDGTVSSEEALVGLRRLIQTYQDQMPGLMGQESVLDNGLDLLA